MPRVRELDGKYPGLPLWCIGRGPSLARLSPAHIGAGPVVAINQAIDLVESLDLSNPLFSMQKDRLFSIPARAVLLVHDCESGKHGAPEAAYHFSAECDLGLPWNSPSVVCAAALARRWGCERVIYLCCDAATDGVTEAYGQAATRPDDYLLHKSMVLAFARLPVEWRRVE